MRSTILVEYFWTVNYFKIDRINKISSNFEIVYNKVRSGWTKGWPLTESFKRWPHTGLSNTDCLYFALIIDTIIIIVWSSIFKFFDSTN